MFRRPQALAAVVFAELVTASAYAQQVTPLAAPTAAESIEDTKSAAEDVPLDRGKSLQISVGLAPSSLDLGSEADILGVRDSREMAAMLER